MRHRFHAICPYFAMFPESFVEKHLAASRYDGVVFDPFCGRGTTIFTSLLNNRQAAGCDVNPVAACIAGAKCNPPSINALLIRLSELQEGFVPLAVHDLPEELEIFFRYCFTQETYAQIQFLRRELNWRIDKTDQFIAALCLGALHGESHRSPNYFSNRMPRTISTKPAYSVRWWQRNGYEPPQRDVFNILRSLVGYRFRSSPPINQGDVALLDARNAGTRFDALSKRVTDVITSPPYLDTTNYFEDQWLRLWFLGEKASCNYARKDGRHYNKEKYWIFLTEAWAGVAPLLSDEARVVIRMGGRRMEKGEVYSSLHESLKNGLGRKARAVDSGVTTLVKRTQANSFRATKVSSTVEHDFCFILS